jgi:hypothetical protein
MAKRFKDLRNPQQLDDWEDIRREDRLREKQKGKKIKSKRQTKYSEKFNNFKDFSDY